MSFYDNCLSSTYPGRNICWQTYQHPSIPLATTHVIIFYAFLNANKHFPLALSQINASRKWRQCYRRTNTSILSIRFSLAFQLSRRSSCKRIAHCFFALWILPELVNQFSSQTPESRRMETMTSKWKKRYSQALLRICVIRARSFSVGKKSCSSRDRSAIASASSLASVCCLRGAIVGVLLSKTAHFSCHALATSTFNW